MFQGVSADIDSKMWLAMQSGMDFDFDEPKKEEKKEIEIPFNINSIGSDEVGTGDYFGPIVVSASYVSKDTTATSKPTTKPTTTPKPTVKPTAKPTATPTPTAKPSAKPTPTTTPTPNPTQTPDNETEIMTGF